MVPEGLRSPQPAQRDRVNADDFAASQRQREWFHALTVPPGMWAIIRVDGRGFSRLTGEHFSKPFDERMHQHMTAAAIALMADFEYCALVRAAITSDTRT